VDLYYYYYYYYYYPFFIHVGLDEENQPHHPIHMWGPLPCGMMGKQPPKENLVGVSRPWMGLPCNTCPPAKFKCLSFL